MAEILSSERFKRLPTPVTLFQGSTEGFGSRCFSSTQLPPGVVHLARPDWARLPEGPEPEIPLLEACVERLSAILSSEAAPRWLWLELPPESDAFLLAQAFHPQSPVSLEGARLHQVVTVLDCAEFWSLFNGVAPLDEESSERLESWVHRIEFCDVLVLVGAERVPLLEQDRFRSILRTLQQRAPMHDFPAEIEALERLWPAPLFSWEETPKSAAWKALLEERDASPRVFRARRPFHPTRLHGLLARWPLGVLRACGQIWLASRNETAIALSLSGPSVLHLSPEGPWIASLPSGEREWALEEHPELKRDWDPTYGDRSIEIAFITEGNLDLGPFFQRLSSCLLTDLEMRSDWSVFTDPFPSGELPPAPEPRLRLLPPTPPSPPPLSP